MSLYRDKDHTGFEYHGTVHMYADQLTFLYAQCSAKTLKSWGQWPLSYEKVGPFPNSSGP